MYLNNKIQPGPKFSPNTQDMKKVHLNPNPNQIDIKEKFTDNPIIKKQQQKIPD